MTSLRVCTMAVPALLLAVLARADFVCVNQPLGHAVQASIRAVAQDKDKKTGIQATVERNQGDAATPDFKFKNVPSPAKENLARKAKVTIVDGTIDSASGGLALVNDGKLPQDQDEPETNFFFDTDTDGGRLAMDLGGAFAIKEVNTYSWHPNTRGPQVYKLYASDGTSKDFKADPQKGTDPAKVGWTLVASVDTRPKGDAKAKGKGKGKGKGIGGQYAVTIADPSGAAIGSYRYLLFDISQTESSDPFGNTFYSEITVIEKK